MKDMKGYFGKLEAGGGLKDKYNNSAMLNAFSGMRKLAGYGIMSNTGQTNLDWKDDQNYWGASANMQAMDDGGFMIFNDGGDKSENVLSLLAAKITPVGMLIEDPFVYWNLLIIWLASMKLKRTQEETVTPDDHPVKFVALNALVELWLALIINDAKEVLDVNDVSVKYKSWFSPIL